MDKHFEKILMGLVALAFIALPFLNSAEASADGDGLVGSYGLINEHPGIVRFHVVANSDSTEDQDLKLEVRDRVLAKVQDELASQVGEAQAYALDSAEYQAIIRKYIQDNLPRIEEWAQETVLSLGYDYDVTASLGIRHIPAKYYGDMFFPEGNYEALTLSIGAGKGQNWWCVVFPPLCMVDSENSSYSEELGVTEEDKLVLKFKTEELMSGITSQTTGTASLNAIYEAIFLIKEPLPVLNRG